MGSPLKLESRDTPPPSSMVHLGPAELIRRGRLWSYSIYSRTKMRRRVSPDLKQSKLTQKARWTARGVWRHSVGTRLSGSGAFLQSQEVVEGEGQIPQRYIWVNHTNMVTRKFEFVCSKG